MPFSLPAGLILLCGLAYVNSLSLFHREQTDFPSEYGVDVSFPIHHPISSQYPLYAEQYRKFIEGCYTLYTREECDDTESGRMAMNLDQPARQHNYTAIGFKKTTAPPEAWEPLIAFYKANVNKEKPERWPRGNTYVNHWVSPSSMISFEDGSLRGGITVKDQIWAGVKPIIEEWVGYPVEPTSLYGVRIYKQGAVLATHVDRLPLVSSAIIQVAQDVDSDWPIEVYDHSGRAHNVSLRPGDMVLYESHTVLHGRPFPLQGRLYANVFVHFQPLGHAANNIHDAAEQAKPKPSKPLFGGLFGGKQQQQAEEKDVGGHEHNNHQAYHKVVQDKNRDPFRRSFDHGIPEEPSDPPQSEDPETPEEAQEEEPDEHEEPFDADKLEEEPAMRWNSLLDAILETDLSKVMELVEADRALVSYHDDNRWTALHEAIREGSTEIVRYLLSRGADVTMRVRGGGDAMSIAETNLPYDHEVIGLLREALTAK